MDIDCSKSLNSQLGYTLWNWLSALRVGECQLETSEFLYSFSLVGFLSATSGWHLPEQVFSQCVPDVQVEVWVAWLCLTLPGQWNVNHPCTLEVKAVSWNKQKFTCSAEGWQIICSPSKESLHKWTSSHIRVEEGKTNMLMILPDQGARKKYKTLLPRFGSFKHPGFFLLIWLWPFQCVYY